MMKSKTNPPEIYLPATSKSYTYYPIENQRNKEVPSERNQATTRIDWHRDRRDKDIDSLKRANEEMREREEIYIDKLMKLEEGLENQHKEFVKLQELYTQLFESYKKKELEISELECKYRESGRYHSKERSIQVKQSHDKENRQQRVSFDSKQRDFGLKELEWVSRQKQWLQRETQLRQLNDNLTEKLLSMNQKFEKLLQGMSNSRAKEKSQTKTVNNDKLMEQLQEWQRRLQTEKETRLKYQYENEFLNNRNRDLQDQRQQLEKLLVYKQKELGKLRQQKIHIHRQTSEKMINRSHSSSSRFAQKSPGVHTESLEIAKQSKNTINEHSLGSNSSKLEQYFSFSRQKRASSMEGLPSFPPELEIDSLIKGYQQ